MKPKRGGPWVKLLEIAAIDPTIDQCVIWPYTFNKAGYGRVPNRKGWGTRLAHRIICEMVYGPPPTPELQAAHKCGVSRCVAPAHLYWATAQENADDRIRHGTSCRGTQHYRAMFTEADVEGIRQSYADGVSLNDLAAKFSCDPRTISLMVRGEHWVDAPGPITRATSSSRAQKGEQIGTAKLTEELVRALRSRRQEVPTPTFSQLAEEFGISRTLACAVTHRKVWAHVM